MKNHLICSIALTLLLSLVVSQNTAINKLLISDSNLLGAGVKARLTPSGTSYVASVVARVLTTQIPITKVPSEPVITRLQSLPSVILSGMKLRLFQVPNSFNVSPVEPNLLTVNLRNVNLSVVTFASGPIGKDFINGSMEIRTWKFSMDVAVRIRKSPIAVPLLKMEQCSVAPNIPLTVLVAKGGLSQENGVRLADSASKDGHTIFEQIICARLRYLLEIRINQRFGFMSTRISIGESANLDLIKTIQQAEKEYKRSIAMSMAPSRSSIVNRRPMMRRNKMIRNGNMMNNRTGIMPRRLTIPRSPRESKAIKLHDGELIHMKNQTNDEIALRSERVQRANKLSAFLNSFNVSRSDSMMLDYALLSNPTVSPRGIEMETSGAIVSGNVPAPFGPYPLSLPSIPSTSMLQLVLSDYVPNTLLFHAHRLGLFNTRVDSTTPQFGSVLRTSCDITSGSLFCLGDIFPTLRDTIPNKKMVLIFSTLSAPAIIVRPENMGGIKFSLSGLLDLFSVEPFGEVHIGAMEIHLDAGMKMKMTSKSVKGKISLDNISLISRAPHVLVQEELDDAGFMSREILQKMVNDIFKQGIPIPVHPMFKIQKPSLVLMNRSILLETNFQLNQEIIRQITSEHLI